MAFVEFYESLMGTSHHVLPLYVSWIANGNVLFPSQQQLLIAPFSFEETRQTVLSMDSNKTPGLDGYIYSSICLLGISLEMMYANPL